jgi:amino acid transporter
MCGGEKNSGQAFIYFSNMASIAGLLTWFGIAVTYLRFYQGMKAQGYVRSALPYYSNFQPFAAWYAVCSISLIMLVSHLLQISMIWSRI